MTMHLLPAFVTTTATGARKKKSKPSVANDKHNQWLMQRGLHPSQLAQRKVREGGHRNSIPSYAVDNRYELSNSIGNGFKKGIMDNLHKESPEVQKEIMQKAMRTTVAYNKGPTMYFSPESDKTNLGSGSRRG